MSDLAAFQYKGLLQIWLNLISCISLVTSTAEEIVREISVTEMLLSTSHPSPPASGHWNQGKKVNPLKTTHIAGSSCPWSQGTTDLKFVIQESCSTSSIAAALGAVVVGSTRNRRHIWHTSAMRKSRDASPNRAGLCRPLTPPRVTQLRSCSQPAASRCTSTNEYPYS